MSAEYFKEISSKLKKDEFYTFLSGISVGTIYFLILVSDSKSEKPINFYIRENYYLSLYLFSACMIATLVLYLVYLFISYPVIWKVEKSASEQISASEGNKLISRRDYEEYIASYPHLYGLLSASLLCLFPIPWIFSSLHWEVSDCFCLAFNGAQVVIFILFYIFAYFPKLKHITILNYKIEKGFLNWCE